MTNKERSKKRQILYEQAKLLRKKYQELTFNLTLVRESEKLELMSKIGFCTKEIKEILNKLWELDKNQKRQRAWGNDQPLAFKRFMSGER